MVCLSVCLPVTTMSPAKAAEPIVISFWMWTRIVPRSHALDGVQIPLGRGGNVESETGPPRTCRTRPKVDILKATQQGAAASMVRMPIWHRVHIGATLRTRLNRPLCGGDAFLDQITLTICCNLCFVSESLILQFYCISGHRIAPQLLRAVVGYKLIVSRYI